MNDENICDWCLEKDLAWRTIRKSDLMHSFVSKPWFREGHCLVIPIRHIASVNELSGDESMAIMSELGRLSDLLDDGYGTGMMQKYMPRQADNGIKMNHLHFHIFPRRKEEEGLFPTPYPNSFAAFYQPGTNQVSELVKRLAI